MSKKQREGEVESPRDYKLVAYIAPVGVVTEGSRVQLDGSQSYFEYPSTKKHTDGNINSSNPREFAIASRPINGEDNVSFLWEQIEGPRVTLENKNSATPSFTAPYLDANTNAKIHKILRFQLVVRDKNGVSSDPPRQVQVVVKLSQRALVLQGGGALGAYEAGVFKALCEDLAKKNKGNERWLFDIVAGTSIGAVNAAIIVGTVLNYKRENSQASQAEIWQNSVRKLEEFWAEISDPLTEVQRWIYANPLSSGWINSWKITTQFGSMLLSGIWDYGKSMGDAFMKNYNNMLERTRKQITDSWPWDWPYLFVFTEEWPYTRKMSWKDKSWKEQWPYISGYFYWPENYGSLATSEAARRYYNYASSLFYGVPRVLLPGIAQPDMKFPLSLTPTFTRFDNSPLSRTIQRYWDYKKYPIKTRVNQNQPRLILVSVDMLDATTAVAFDSYANQDDRCISEYGDNEFKHIIEHPKGITIEHVIASMSTHLRYKYPEMEVKNNGDTEGKGEKRLFWDGAYLSNTPLRELLHMHKQYWQGVRKETVELEGGDKITLAPDLEIYIVNLYPTIEKEVPADADAIQDREIDIKFHDRTNYDVKVAEMTTDYLELVEQLINIGYKNAEYDSAFKADLEKLLNERTKSKKRAGEKRIYRDILDGRADITKVVYIDRRDDGNTIFGKAFEFSSKTINELKTAGYNDAKISVQFSNLRNAITDLGDRKVLSADDERILDQKFTAIINYVKHDHRQKGQDALDDFIVAVERIIAAGKSSAERSSLSELVQSVRTLQEQLGVVKQTTATMA